MKRARPGLVELKFVADGFRPARYRWRGGWRALGLAMLAHGLLFAILLTGVQWARPPTAAPVQAYLADVEPKPVKTVEPEKPKAKPEAAKEPPRKEAESPPVVDKRKATELQKAQEEAKRRAAEDKKRAEEKKRTEDEKKKAEARRREEDAKRHKDAEQSLQESLAAEESARVAASKLAQQKTQIDHHTELVRQRVTRNWSRPPGAAKGLKCTVRVRVAPGGEVLGATVVRSSGNVAFDRSVEAAVYKSAPLPVPTERELFERFREINFEFKPED